MTHIYLASKSPRRRDILNMMGVSYALVDNQVVETRNANEAPTDYVVRLAIEKSKQAPTSDIPCLGADTIGVINDIVLEKPLDREHAFKMWRLMSGETHSIYSAVALSQGSVCHYRLLETQVSFKSISELEMERYWASGEPQDKAGGYAIQGLGGLFVSRINGSYHSVVGLPMVETADLLKRFNIPIMGVK